MKKLSTLVCAVLASGVSFAQNSGVPMKPAAEYNMRKTLMTERTQVVTPQVDPNRAVIWSDDFSTPSNWTMTNTSSPSCDFQIVTQLTSSLQTQGFDATINSVSGGNFALIDSDAMGNTATQDAYMVTTNSIDLTTANAVQVSFLNYHRRYQETHYVVVSIDGGATWTEIEVNGTYPTSTTSPNAESVTVNLTCIAANQSNVKIGFHYVGAWDWFWAIDDVVLEDASPDDVKLSTARYYSTTQTSNGDNPRYTIFPAAQAQPMQFAGYVQNIGSSSQTNAKIAATVKDPSNASVFTGAGAGASLGTCSNTAIDDMTTTTYTSSSVGVYTDILAGTYDNIMNDATPNDNIDTLYHEVNNSYYGVDDNTYRGSGLWNQAGNGYSMGPLYAMYANETLYSIDVALTSNTSVGVVMCAQLYSIDASGNFNLETETCGGSHEITVGAGDLSSGGTITWVHNVLDAPFSLQSGTEYIACVQHYGGADDLIIMQGGTGADTSTIFILDGTDNTWYYMTSFPMVRMNFNASVGVREIANSNMQLYQNVPNPANGTTRITFSLENAAEVNFSLVDLTGKEVMNSNMGDLGTGVHNMTLDVSKFATGIYYYTVTANGEKMTKKMVITE